MSPICQQVKIVKLLPNYLQLIFCSVKSFYLFLQRSLEHYILINGRLTILSLIGIWTILTVRIMSSKRPRLWYTYIPIGLLYHMAWALLIIYGLAVQSLNEIISKSSHAFFFNPLSSRNLVSTNLINYFQMNENILQNNFSNEVEFIQF